MRKRGLHHWFKDTIAPVLKASYPENFSKTLKATKLN
jgi:hypothetical protein